MKVPALLSKMFGRAKPEVPVDPDLDALVPIPDMTRYQLFAAAMKQSGNALDPQRFYEPNFELDVTMNSFLGDISIKMKQPEAIAALLRAKLLGDI